MVLLIDDTRNLFADLVARNYKDGMEFLRHHEIDILILDADLGWESKSGIEVLKDAIEEGILPVGVQLVTMNPVARKQMQGILLDHNYITMDGFNFRRKQ